MQEQTIHLGNLREHSKQQVFDFIVRSLFEQGRPSYSNGACLYHSYDESGKIVAKCAAGHLITAEQYKEIKKELSVAPNQVFEGSAWDDLSNGNYSTIPTDHSDLIYDCQIAHDAADDLSGTHSSHRHNDIWRTHFSDVASKHFLDTEVLDHVS